MTKLLLSLLGIGSRCLEAQMCYILPRSKSACLRFLWVRKKFEHKRDSVLNSLWEWNKVSVQQEAQTLCHLWKYCTSSLLERNASCSRERALCRAVHLFLSLTKLVARQQWKTDDVNSKVKMDVIRHMTLRFGWLELWHLLETFIMTHNQNTLKRNN